MKREGQVLGGPGMRGRVSGRKEAVAKEEEMRLKTNSQGPCATGDSVPCNLARSEGLQGFNVYIICLLIFQYCCWDLGNSWRFRVGFLPPVSRRIIHLLLTCLPRGSSEEAQPQGMDLGGRGSPGPTVMICRSRTAASGNKAK